MATVTTLAKAAGGRGNPSKKPYMVEVEIDLAAAATAKGSALAAADVIQCITVDANTAVMFAGAEITVAPTGGSGATFDLGITGGDVDAFVDGMAITSAAAGTYSTLANTACPIITGSDTIDMLLIGTTPDTAGKIRVFALLMDVDSMGAQAADEVDRDLLAQIILWGWLTAGPIVLITKGFKHGHYNSNVYKF